MLKQIVPEYFCTAIKLKNFNSAKKYKYKYFLQI